MTTDPYGDDFNPLAEFDALVADLQAKADGAATVQREIDALHIVVWAPERILSVTIGSQGNVENVELTHRAMGLDAADLASCVLDTLRRAYGELQTRLEQMVAESVPSAATTAIVEQYRAAFAEPLSHLKNPQSDNWS